MKSRQVLVFQAIAIAFVALNFNPADVRPGSCTKEEVSRFDKAITRVEKELSSTAPGSKSWKELEATFRKYSKCDDGFLAEGLSDVIVRLLASKWSTSKEFFASHQGDDKFIQFVVRHVDMTATAEDINHAKKNAETDCTDALKSFCAKVISRADELRKEADSIRTKSQESK